MFHDQPSRRGFVLLSAILLSTQLAWVPAATAATPGAPIRYTYDPSGRLSAVIDPAAGSAQYAYDAAGNNTSITRRAATVAAILEFSPRSGPTGTQVTIDGTGFSATPSQNTVKVHGVVATVVSATPTEIVATVPASATTGTISVTSPAGTATSTASFTVGSVVPTVSGFSPAMASPGATLTITGTNFDTTAASDSARVSLLLAKVTSATATSIAAVVPPGASGHVSVTTRNGTATSSGYFFVPPPGRTTADIDDTKTATIGGAAVTATVTHAGNDALIVFDGTQGQLVAWTFGTVTVSNSVTILAPDGSTLRGAQGTGSGTFYDSMALPMSGTYTIWVDGSVGTVGTLAVQVLSVPPDATATGTIGGPMTTVTTTVSGQNAKILFDATQGTLASWLMGYTAYNNRARILNPDGSVLRDWQGTANGIFFEPLTLPATGTYTIAIDGIGSEAGSLTFQVFSVPADASATGTMGGPMTTVTTTTPGQNAKILFDGTQGTLASWLMGYTAYNNRARILNPDGSVLRDWQGTANGIFFEPLTLPATGTYTIAIDGIGSEYGGLTFQVLNVPADATATATVGGPLTTVTTTVSGQNAKILFDGTQGTLVSWLFGTTTYNNRARILNPDGSVLRDWQGTSNGLLFPALTLPATGTYTMAIDGIGPDYGSIGVQVQNGRASPRGRRLMPRRQSLRSGMVAKARPRRASATRRAASSPARRSIPRPIRRRRPVPRTGPPIPRISTVTGDRIDPVPPGRTRLRYGQGRVSQP